MITLQEPVKVLVHRFSFKEKRGHEACEVLLFKDRRTLKVEDSPRTPKAVGVWVKVNQHNFLNLCAKFRRKITRLFY